MICRCSPRRLSRVRRRKRSELLLLDVIGGYVSRFRSVGPGRRESLVPDAAHPRRLRENTARRIGSRPARPGRSSGSPRRPYPPCRLYRRDDRFGQPSPADGLSRPRMLSCARNCTRAPRQALSLTARPGRLRRGHIDNVSLERAANHPRGRRTVSRDRSTGTASRPGSKGVLTRRENQPWSTGSRDLP